MAILVLALATVAVLAFGYVINGWVLTVLWRWFILPLGAPAIDLPWAIGLAIVIGFTTNHSVPKKDEDADTAVSLLYLFFRPLLALLVGWVVRQWM